MEAENGNAVEGNNGGGGEEANVVENMDVEAVAAQNNEAEPVEGAGAQNNGGVAVEGGNVAEAQAAAAAAAAPARARRRRGTKRKKKKAKPRKEKEPRIFPDAVPLPKRQPGLVMAFGRNKCGQLGMDRDKPEPSFIPFFEKKLVKSVACGATHTAVLDAEGNVWTFGSNHEHHLGRIVTCRKEEVTPGRVDIPAKVKTIVAGDFHTAALTVDGQVYAWGCYKSKDKDGKATCHGVHSFMPEEEEAEVCPMPHLITGHLWEQDNVRIIRIASGGSHLAMVGNDAQLYTCGAWHEGQLGRYNEPLPTITTRATGEPKTENGCLLTDTDFYIRPRMARVGHNATVRKVWASKNATFCLAGDIGRIYVCGYNLYSQLGIRMCPSKQNKNIWQMTHATTFNRGDFENVQWRQFAGGSNHTVALTATGAVYTLGLPENGKLGLVAPVVNQQGNVGAIPFQVQKFADNVIIHIAAGDETSYAVTFGGEVHTWGYAESLWSKVAQLFTKEDPQRLLPHLCNVARGNEGLCWDVMTVAVGKEHVALLVEPPEPETEDDSDANAEGE